MALRLIKKAHEVTILGGEHLDDITTPGTYHQNMVVNALPELNYPEKTAGLLEVWNPDARMMYQRYTCFWSGNMYYRGSYDKAWKPWKKILTE